MVFFDYLFSQGGIRRDVEKSFPVYQVVLFVPWGLCIFEAFFDKAFSSELIFCH